MKSRKKREIKEVREIKGVGVGWPDAAGPLGAHNKDHDLH